MELLQLRGLFLVVTGKNSR